MTERQPCRCHASGDVRCSRLGAVGVNSQDIQKRLGPTPVTTPKAPPEVSQAHWPTTKKMPTRMSTGRRHCSHRAAVGSSPHLSPMRSECALNPTLADNRRPAAGAWTSRQVQRSRHLQYQLWAAHRHDRADGGMCGRLLYRLAPDQRQSDSDLVDREEAFAIVSYDAYLQEVQVGIEQLTRVVKVYPNSAEEEAEHLNALPTPRSPLAAGRRSTTTIGRHSSLGYRTPRAYAVICTH